MGEDWYKGLEDKDREEQKKVKREEMENARFHSWYKDVKGEGIPGYLKKGWGRVDGEGWLGLGWRMR